MPATIDVLKTDPLKFLKVFPIKISTSKESRVENQVFYGKKQSALRFNTGWPDVDDPSSVETCRAHIVKAEHGAPRFHALSDEADLMITSQLSGCCMILDKTSAPPKIAHVWPHTSRCQCTNRNLPVETGDAVQGQLAAGFKSCKLYGIKDYIQTYAYVIGVKKGGWRFFAQERPNDGPIKRAFEIFL